MDNSLKEKLLDQEEGNKGYSEKFSVDYFSDLFVNQNINEGNSLRVYLSLRQEGFLSGVNSSTKGLDSDDLDDMVKRKTKYGSNARVEKEDKSYMDFVWESLEDQMMQILIAASIVSTVIGILQEGLSTGWIEGASIFLAVVIVTGISSFQNWSKDQQFKQLDKENSKKNVKLVRDGLEIKEVDVDEIVVGDILHLAIGDISPADGILIKDSVTMDESAMTGESDLQVKVALEEKMTNKVNPFIISGTQVMDGSGKMLVLAVGPNKVSGKSDDLMEAETDETPLQTKLKDVADKIGDLGLMAAIFIGLVLILKDIIMRISLGLPIFSAELLDSFINAFIICITVIVVAIPEGLPMAVTISLAFSVSKMRDQHNLVRHLDASETMGNVNNVCTDKTGTLTMGVMTLRNFYMEGKDNSTNNELDISAEGLTSLTECITNNITAYAEKDNDKMIARGNFTEAALLQFMINQKIDYQDPNVKYPSYVRTLPFSSEYKFMCTLVQVNTNVYRLFIKGAPERVLNYCTKIRGASGKNELISKYSKDINEQQEKYASQCMRTLAIGFKEFTDKKLEGNNAEGMEFFEPLLNEITLTALFGIADAPRPEVPDSIDDCSKAGVTVRMVTGDNIKTAIAIAQDVRIISPREGNESLQRIKAVEDGDKGGLNMPSRIIALEGNEFRELSGGYIKIEDGKDKVGKIKYRYELASQEKFKKTTENLKVIARASPDDKFLLVLGLKQLNNIVAVTGDGTNDAPAMKKSDVGFAMGKRGTDIAKAASDIVLLDDSFHSIITAMKYGRNVYDCIRKFLQFQLTCNVVAVFMTLLGGVILKDSPLTSIQMLWVNLIMDSFASLALATEAPNDKLLKRKPYPKDQDIVTGTMKINIGAQSCFQIIILTFIIFYGDLMFGVPSDRELDHFTWNNSNGYHFTIFFNIFVFLQVFNSVNARKLLRSEVNVFEGIFNNYLYLMIQGIIIVGQIAMVQFGGRALRTHALSLNQHLGCLAIASLSLVIGLLVKLLPIGIDEHTEGPPGFSISKSIRGRKSVDSSRVRSSKSIKF
eukprot:CAMPEP_0170521718 /NCGR_PEP_ID=MMETSP0209-20121228/7085_1 /TAXON_ID=665100 ORGANISM="Litonotus pictus, Strain P1" /NCGR_SAMPLE_ID=MMETSP0209 /ASSEMBLY_ACC=CAM_ASM_000301 /LENGTH=1049 /DNA_ID=CAMNT_0010808745 /DNA_START=1 /DNA_END=3150 /DNA_ORIENTATION=-